MWACDELNEFECACWEVGGGGGTGGMVEKALEKDAACECALEKLGVGACRVGGACDAIAVEVVTQVLRPGIGVVERRGGWDVRGGEGRC